MIALSIRKNKEVRKAAKIEKNSFLSPDDVQNFLTYQLFAFKSSLKNKI